MLTEKTPRAVLFNCTNAVSLPSQNRDHSLKRRVSIDRDGSRKRLKFQKTPVPEEHVDLDDESMHPEFPRTEARSDTAFRSLRNARMQPRRTLQNSFSTTPILRTFVSSNKSDVFKLHSEENPMGPGVPFACAFSADAKKGGLPILAVAMQEGKIELLNVRKREDWDPEPQRTSIYAHKNAILDVKWGFNDQTLATASGDSTSQIISATTKIPVAVLSHHKSSVKTLDWDPTHADILSTASRDGSICVWDLRTASHGDVGNESIGPSPVMVIPHAHWETTPRGGVKKSQSSPRTVTSLVYLPQCAQQILSSGSFDGVLKQWDLRYPTSGRRKKPTLLFESWMDPTLESSRRSRGISGLALGRNRSAGTLWGLAADSCIHTYSMPLSAPFAHSAPHNKFTHPGLYVNSFYVKLACSPCGTWLASGSSGGGIYLWDVAGRRPGPNKAVELKATGQEIGAVDWASDFLAACCDDGTVRIWRPNFDISTNCRRDPQEQKWDWAWASDDI